VGKRSNFKRRKQDAYYTPPEAVEPLIPYIGDITYYIDPCCGDGAIDRAMDGPWCVLATDIEEDARTTKYSDILSTCHLSAPEAFITNPPWTRELLHPIIENLSDQLPTWLLFDADWKYTKQESLAKRIGCKTVPELLERCVKIVAVGRVSWMQNGTSSLDNCAWYLFDKNFTGQTEFYGRGVR
jgi:hypothetical protein